MVSIFDLCFSYTEEPPYLLNHLSLDIPAGAYWSVVGPNGAGKSTFIKLVLGLLKPTSGRIEISAQGVGYVPQMSAPAAASFPITAKDSIDHALSSVGMSAARHTLFGDLSGGQRQRILIARALLGDNDLIVLDEPSTGLDRAGRDEIYDLLTHLNHKHGTTIIAVEHNLEAVYKCSSGVLEIENGQWALHAPAEYQKRIETEERAYVSSEAEHV